MFYHDMQYVELYSPHLTCLWQVLLAPVILLINTGKWAWGLVNFEHYDSYLKHWQFILLLKSNQIKNNIGFSSYMSQRMTCAQWRLRSAGVSAQSDQSFTVRRKKLGSLATHWAHSKDRSNWADQRLCWVLLSVVKHWLLYYLHCNSHISKYCYRKQKNLVSLR